MKFGKLLLRTADDMPGMGSIVLRYKTLKKQLKAMQPVSSAGNEPSTVPDAVDALSAEYTDSMASGVASLTTEERNFINILNEDLARFNEFFMDKEEESIIKLRALQEQLPLVHSEEERGALRTKFVDLHGEMVLLLHWSLLNYAAVVKILKKHDKRTGVLLRAPFLANVLRQPFYSTEGISRLVKAAEEHVRALSRQPDESEGSDVSDGERSRRNKAELLKRTQAALGMWKELGEKASTPSTVLPVSDARMGSTAATAVRPSTPPPTSSPSHAGSGNAQRAGHQGSVHDSVAAGGSAVASVSASVEQRLGSGSQAGIPGAVHGASPEHQSPEVPSTGLQPAETQQLGKRLREDVVVDAAIAGAAATGAATGASAKRSRAKQDA